MKCAPSSWLAEIGQTLRGAVNNLLQIIECAKDAATQSKAQAEQYRQALGFIRRHVKDQPSALAVAIVATIDAALAPGGEKDLPDPDITGHHEGKSP